MSEIEHYAKEAHESHPECICVAFQMNGLIALGLAIHSEPLDKDIFIDYIKSQLPPYEVPSKIIFFKNFPLNVNGKIDRKEIIKHFENE